MAQTFSFPNYGLFNATYYLQQNPDVATSWTGTPLQHYIQYGALEGRAPDPYFNADFYRASYTDLQSMNALQLFNHYCNYGYNEGRVPMLNFSNFNGVRYLLDNPDVAAAGYTAANAVSHFVAFGEYEGRVAYAQNGVVIDPVVNEGDVFTLTTSADNFLGTQYNDFFDGSLNGFGLQTLNSGDQLDGAGGVDTLDATISASVTPLSLNNIEIIEATATAAATLGLLNAGQVTQITNDGSSATLVFGNVAAGATTVNVQNTSNSTSVNYASTTGSQTVGLNLSNVTGAAAVTIAGVETVNVASNNAPNSVDLELAAATSIGVSGSANLTIAPLSTGGNTINVSNVNASALTGNLTLDMGTQTGVLASTDISVTGGQGNDSITMSGITQDYIVTLGAGNDTVVDTAITNNDSIEGGLGNDTLSTTFVAADALTTVNGINGMDVLTVTTATTGNGLTLTDVDSTISTFNVAVAGPLTITDTTVTGAAGTLTVNLGTTGAGNAGALANTLTFTDTGTALTDALNINNLSVNSTTGANVNVFASQNVVSAGYENVAINTGAASNAAQAIGVLTVNADAASAPVSLTVAGTNSLSIASLASNSTGLTTVDASQLSAQAAGTNSFTLASTALATAASTLSVTGTAGDDVLNIGAANVYSSTLIGGAGNDLLTGGVSADHLHGDVGNDTLTGSGGNDTIHGGDGNDTIDATAAGVVSIEGGLGNDTVSMAATLTQTDIVNGNEGVDTLAVTAAITGTTGVGVTNFEVLSTTADQVLTNAVNNSWTTVLANAQGVDVTNALSTTNTFQVNDNADGGSASFARLTDTGTDSLTFATSGTGALAFDGTITALTADNEESITIDVSNGLSTAAGALTITTLNAADLTSLTLTGDHNVTIAAAIGGNTTLATVNASALTGTATVNASNSTVAVTMTGTASTVNTFTGGVNADSITGGSAADVLAGGNGADTLVGNGGNDNLNGGAGADSISAGAGTDAVTAGTQADVVTLSVDAQTDTITQGAADSVANTASAIQNGATFSAGDTVTFGNGVDVIYNFLAGAAAVGGDTLIAGTNVSTSLLNTTTNVAATGWLSGTYANGVFTVAANGVGPDTIVFRAGNVGANAGQAVVLLGVDSDNLLNSNFSGVNLTTIVAQYGITAGTTFDFAAGAFAIQQVTVAANGTVTAEAGANITQAAGFNQAAVTVMDFSALAGGFGVNATFDTAVSTVLATVTGTTANDSFTFSDTTSFNGVNTTVAGNGGTDTLTFTNMRAGNTTIDTAQLVGIDSVSLTNGTTDATSTTRSLTFTNAETADVINASATANATVILGTSALQSYTSNSSGVDTVTVNQVGQSVSTGTGNDQVNLNVAGVYTGAIINMGTGAADVLSLTDVGGGTYNLINATLTGIDTLDTGNINAAYVLAVDTVNDAAIGAYNFNGGTADTLRLADGTYNFSAKTVTFATAGSALDLNTLGTAAKTVTLDAADINNVVTITGEAAAVNTTLNFNDTVSLAAAVRTGGVTNIDVVTMGGANQTLSLDGSGPAGFAATQYTTVTGNGSSNLTVTVDGNADLTNTTISGFDTIDMSALATNRTVTLDGASISNAAAVTLLGHATTDLTFTSDTTATNWTLTAGDFNVVTLGAGVDLNVSELFLSNTVTDVVGNAGGVETFNISASAAASAIDMSNIATTTNLDQINVTGGAGNNIVTTSSVDATRGITSISLANSGTDRVNINNAAVTTNLVAQDVAITGFTTGAGGGVISSREDVVGSVSNGAFYGDTTGAVALALNTGDVVEIDANTVTFGTLTNTTAVLNWLIANFITSNNGGDIATIVAFDGAGTAGIYQVEETGAAPGNFDVIELVGTVSNVANNSFVATNFA